MDVDHIPAGARPARSVLTRKLSHEQLALIVLRALLNAFLLPF